LNVLDVGSGDIGVVRGTFDLFINAVDWLVAGITLGEYADDGGLLGESGNCDYEQQK
jgi:hypothetical protein